MERVEFGRCRGCYLSADAYRASSHRQLPDDAAAVDDGDVVGNGADSSDGDGEREGYAAGPVGERKRERLCPLEPDGLVQPRA